MSKRFQKTQTRISIATCLTRNQRWFSALKKIKLHAGITLMKGEPTLSSGMWKQTKVEKGPHLPPPYVVNHHLSGQRFKKHAMKSNAENVRSCWVCAWEDGERRRETFHGWVIVVVAPVSSLVVSLAFQYERYLLSLNASRHAGMIYIVFAKANGNLYIMADFIAISSSICFGFFFFLNNDVSVKTLRLNQSTIRNYSNPDSLAVRALQNESKPLNLTKFDVVNLSLYLTLWFICMVFCIALCCTDAITIPSPSWWLRHFQQSAPELF